MSSSHNTEKNYEQEWIDATMTSYKQLRIDIEAPNPEECFHRHLIRFYKKTEKKKTSTKSKEYLREIYKVYFSLFRYLEF